VQRPELTGAVLTATLELLEQSGYERLSMDQVARRAGVGKAALYRRWRGKRQMVIAALATLSVPAADIGRLGSVGEAVHALLRGVLDWLTAPRIRAILPDLIAQAGRHPELAQALAEQIGGPRRRYADLILQRWTTSDEAGQRAREMAIDLLAAPVFWRLSQQLETDDDYLEQLADLVTGLLSRPDVAR
jgi:AcrR family transcriptional regulator